MKIIVIGCTHAGIAAITQILTEHPDASVTVYERHDNVSFLSCGISLYLSGQVKHLEDMFYSSPAELRALGATVNLQHDVLQIDKEARQISVENLQTKAIFMDHYDKLIMATGSSVAVPPLFGIDEEQVLLCKDYAQAQAIYQTAQIQHHITIVGGGYVGVELAESYATTEHEVTLIQGPNQLLNNYVDEALSAVVVDRLQQAGVNICLNERVLAFYGEDGQQVTIETSIGQHQADLVIVCTGFVPNSELLRGQVALAHNGAILIDDYLQTSDPNIYAAGDVCVVKYNPTAATAYIPLATNAIRQGMLAGRNVFGSVQKYLGTQATSAMSVFGDTLATTGLTLKRALTAGFNARSVTYEGLYRPDYMPDTAPLTIVLVYDLVSRRVLGAQLFSPHEVAQSANTISVIIQNQNTIDDLAYVDMLFQPQYDYPFNYLNLVAQAAIKQAADQENKQSGERS
ncbi:FAD-dependent oxidoreductase [Furfurilactobacillus curtus]|uniref:NADH oxidase n=1 Tax=Furfurilactobacillus curtus TaxID=1746200 RepID=A0ABQ5JQ73_9LACO